MSVRALIVWAALLVAGCRVDADLEIDLRRSDGGFWRDDAGVLLVVEMCTQPWRGETTDTDAGELLVAHCVQSASNAPQMFKKDERDLIGVFVDGDFGARIFWYLKSSFACWALEVEPPSGQLIHVTLPAAARQLPIAPDCVPPKCTVRPCR